MVIAGGASATRANDHEIPTVAKHSTNLLVRGALECRPLGRRDIALMGRNVEPQQTLRQRRRTRHERACNRGNRQKFEKFQSFVAKRAWTTAHLSCSLRLPHLQTTTAVPGRAIPRAN